MIKRVACGLILSIGASLLLGACAVVGTDHSEGSAPAIQRERVESREERRSRTVEERRQERGAQREPVYGGDAVVDLMSRARELGAEGNHSAAGSAIERALRIEPRNPALWYNLGINYLRLHDYVECENASFKSLSHINSAHSLYVENWRLIAECRTQRGDRKGAESALQRVNGSKK